MFTVYPHEWKELASATATCAHRTAAQTAASPESPAVCQSPGVAGGRGKGGEGQGRPRKKWGGQAQTQREGAQNSMGKRGEEAGGATDNKATLTLTGRALEKTVQGRLPWGQCLTTVSRAGFRGVGNSKLVFLSVATQPQGLPGGE